MLSLMRKIYMLLIYAASHAVITQVSEQINLVIALAISIDKSIVEDSVLVTGIINLI
jgi:hypothetical protein